MGNSFSRKLNLKKAVVVIELANTYTRHTIHATVEESEEPIVYTSEQNPYSYVLKKNRTIKRFGIQAELKLSNSELQHYYSFASINQGLNGRSLLGLRGKKVYINEVSQNAFMFHKAEVNLYISKTFHNESQKREICWVIVLPAGTNDYARDKIRQASKTAGLNDDVCRLVFSTDVLALNEAWKTRKTDLVYKRESTKISLVYLQDGIVENCSYDIFHDGTMCNNSRNTTEIDGGSIKNLFEKFLCELFSEEFIASYKREHKHRFYGLCAKFNKEFEHYDFADEDFTLYLHHLIEKHPACYSFRAIDFLITNSLYRDSVRYNVATSSIILSKQLLQQILDDYVALCQNVLPKNQVRLICYVSVNQSTYLQQRIEQEFQNNNIGLLRSLACKEGKAVISDFSYGYVAIENFNKELHSDQNRCLIDLENTGDECAIWIFKTLIQKGERVSVFNRYTWSESMTFFSREKKQSNHQIILLRSASETPKHINEEGFEEATTIHVKPPTEGWPDEVQFLYTLSFIEKGAIIQVVDSKAGREHQAVFSYKHDIKFMNDPTFNAIENTVPERLLIDRLIRRAPYTYGIRTDPPFKVGVHQEGLRYFDDEGYARCRGVFQKLIEKGQTLHYGQVFSEQIGYSSLRQLFVYLYRSPLENPQNTTDPEDQCEQIPKLDFANMPNHSAQLEVRLIVEDTCFVFKIIDMAIGETIWERIF